MCTVNSWLFSKGSPTLIGSAMTNKHCGGYLRESNGPPVRRGKQKKSGKRDNRELPNGEIDRSGPRGNQ